MARENNPSRGNERDLTTNRTEQQSSVPNDLPDSPRDEERLRPEETIINLPDVSDIPGQEFVRGRTMGEMADTTISSEDEEGDRVFGDERDEGEVEYVMGTEGDVGASERKALEDDEFLPTRDEHQLRDAGMDNVDFQGEALNERGFGDERTGGDLDVPQTEDDDRMENIGEEDEENNAYSLGSDDNDNFTEGTP
ncbi:hypothetical protein V9K67_16235 [Paraflavisolibacter sp. H34]|uniref:hypothetical protein n=1 Tax=Huijunlia imazamoxiresistens TaxID=3127457 RepID=UPI0030188906